MLPERRAAGRTRMRRRLLAWYRRRRRALPWRETRDPYAVWVSETMLQQTRVETVLRYYTPFLERFPTVAALARANTASVLACWSGLGYYARARNLHAAARAIVRRHGGRVPRDPADLAALPGIGRYT
ncbi:MAG: A/G-specific adenine glycosylase, partial [Candidatus Binatia bacterium]